MARSIVAVIGTTTTRAAQTAGLPVHIIPEQSTAKDLALAIVSYFEHLSKENHTMLQNDLLLRACKREPVERTPSGSCAKPDDICRNIAPCGKN